MHVAASEYVFKCSSHLEVLLRSCVHVYAAPLHTRPWLQCCECPVLEPVLSPVLSQWGEECGELSLHLLDNAAIGWQLFICIAVPCRNSTIPGPMSLFCGRLACYWFVLLIYEILHTTCPAHGTLNTIHVDTGITNYWFSWILQNIANNADERTE